MNDITIIVPFYNDSKNVVRLLESIQGEFVRVIIVDDYSDSDQYKKLLELTKKYKFLEVIKNNSDRKGAGVCRNIGLKAVTSKWIMFADSDDHFLGNFQKTMEKNRRLDYEIIYFPPVSFDESGNKSHRHKTYTSYFKDETLNSLKYKLPVVWSRLYNNEFIKKNEIYFDESIVSNDRMFSLVSGVKAEKILVSKDVIYSWNYNSNSLTTKMSKERFSVNVEVFIRVNNYLKKNVSIVIFKKYAESGMKILAMSLLRYKYGIVYTFNLACLLKKNKIKLFKIEDFRRIANFFLNNKYYNKG